MLVPRQPPLASGAAEEEENLFQGTSESTPIWQPLKSGLRRLQSGEKNKKKWANLAYPSNGRNPINSSRGRRNAPTGAPRVERPIVSAAQRLNGRRWKSSAQFSALLVSRLRVRRVDAQGALNYVSRTPPPPLPPHPPGVRGCAGS